VWTWPSYFWPQLSIGHRDDNHRHSSKWLGCFAKFVSQQMIPWISMANNPPTFRPFVSRYDSGPHIGLKRTQPHNDNKPCYESDIPVCEGCRLKRYGLSYHTVSQSRTQGICSGNWSGYPQISSYSYSVEHHQVIDQWQHIRIRVGRAIPRDFAKLARTRNGNLR